MITQRIWQSGGKWDDLIPSDIASDCKLWQRQLPELTKIRIPRWKCSLHGITDASEKAYVRIETTNDKTVHDDCVSIPCDAAEKNNDSQVGAICAAKLLVELLPNIKVACGFNELKTTLRTDSTIVLQWMKKDRYVVIVCA